MSDLFSIRKEVSPRVRWTLAFSSWAFLVLLWIVLTQWEILPPFSLPKPLGVIRAFGKLWTEYDLLGNVFQSWWRIAQAFFWCAVVAIPLGMFFYLLAVVVEEANRVDNALLETAYTLGARQRHALWLVFRASFPAIFASFRILYDIGWTYVILAEMVNARKGVGYMVEAARKVLDFERVYAGIIAIGIAAFLFRFLLTFLESRLFPWRKTAAALADTGAAVPSATAHLKAAKHGA